MLTFTNHSAACLSCIICHVLLFPPPPPVCPADSRLYGGVHFRSANDDGLKLGRLVGAKVFDRIQPAAGSKAAGSKATTESAAKPAASGRRLLAWHFRTVHTL